MPKRLRLTRRFPVAMTNDAYRSLHRFAAEAEITPDEALCFLFEHFNSVTNAENLTARLRLFKAELPDRKA
ncbi:hypothetical protein C8J27_102181 [Rhodobacter aestuarii]|uniref:Uncharacterized protein n=1 Tax=Rhodobacter aestuarii TaxID=453582 RepID=A0A1N7NDA3_9RHOB|nr:MULTISPECIES: hypothetical protein [Rhodobacter]PTV96387.1 hypothetical protein C8J27_102181 [Rhodobacter aestuarii]SIS96211.1 hypothetical protein SAMN05421580_107181 [Rhodobacter aestuarii]SOB92461.1 hypothetical protein SAMN05877809_101552 [Rhodobacter sp. JA431]